MFCARVMRGSSSMAKAVTPVFAIASKPSCGDISAMRIEPGRSDGNSASVGRRTFRMMSAAL